MRTTNHIAVGQKTVLGRTPEASRSSQLSEIEKKLFGTSNKINVTFER